MKTKPSFPEDKIVQLRYNLIKEELEELKVAIKDRNIILMILSTTIYSK